MKGIQIFEYWMKHTQIYLKKIHGKKFPNLSKDEQDLIRKSCLFYRQDLFSKVDCNKVNLNNDSGDSVTSEQLSENSSITIAQTAQRILGRNILRTPNAIKSYINLGRVPKWFNKGVNLVKSSFEFKRGKVDLDIDIDDAVKQKMRNLVEELKENEKKPSGEQFTLEEVEERTDELAKVLTINNYADKFDDEKGLLTDVKHYASEGEPKGIKYNSGNSTVTVENKDGTETQFNGYGFLVVPYSKAIKSGSDLLKNIATTSKVLVDELKTMINTNTVVNGFLNGTAVRIRPPNRKEKEEEKATGVLTTKTVLAITSNAFRYFHKRFSTSSRKKYHKAQRNLGQTNRGLNMRETASMFDEYDENGKFLGNRLEQYLFSTYVPHAKMSQYDLEVQGSNTKFNKEHQDALLAEMARSLVLKERRDSLLVDFYSDPLVTKIIPKKNLYRVVVSPNPPKGTGKKQQQLAFGVGSAGKIAKVLNGLDNAERLEIAKNYPFLFPPDPTSGENPLINKNGTLKIKPLTQADLRETGPGNYGNLSENLRDGVMPTLDPSKVETDKDGNIVGGYNKALAEPIVARTKEILSDLQANVGSFYATGGDTNESPYSEPEKSKIFEDYLRKFAQWQVEGMKFMGLTPYYFEDHHQLPLDDLGDNNIGNFVLMRLDHHRAVAHVTHKSSFSSNGMGKLRDLVNSVKQSTIKMFDNKGIALDFPKVSDANLKNSKFKSETVINVKKDASFNFENRDKNPLGQQPGIEEKSDVSVREGDAATLMIPIVTTQSPVHVDYDPKKLDRTLDHDIVPPVLEEEKYTALIGSGNKKKEEGLE